MKYHLDVDKIDKAQLHLNCAKNTITTLIIAFTTGDFSPADHVMIGTLGTVGELIDSADSIISAGAVAGAAPTIQS